MKFRFLIKDFLKRKFRSKSFILVVAIFIVAGILLALIPKLIGSSKRKTEAIPKNAKILVVSEKNTFTDNDKEKLSNSISIKIKDKTSYIKDVEIKVELNKYDDLPSGDITGKINHLKSLKDIKEKDYNLIILYTKIDGILNGGYYQNEKNYSLKNLAQEIISETDFILNDITPIKITSINKEVNNYAINNNSLISIYMFFAIFIIMFSIQNVAPDVVLEKANRVIEQIMMNVSDKKHLMAKVIGGFSFTLTLLLIAISSVLISFAMINRDMFLCLNFLFSDPKSINFFILAITSLLVGSFFYIILFTYIAALTNNIEDYNTISSPILVIIIIIFQLTMTFGMGDYSFADTLYKVLNYLPIFNIPGSSIAYLGGYVKLGDAIVGMFLNIPVIIYFFYLMSPIYKSALLNYSNKKNIFSRIKYYRKQLKHKRERKKNDNT